MGPASIAGVVISVVGFVFFVGLYVYRTHFAYLKRFITLKLGKYNFLAGDDDHESKNMAHQDDEDDMEMNKVQNPLLQEDSAKVRSRSTSSGGGRDDEAAEETQHISSLGITKGGYLMKQTTNMQRNWVRRWFFIKDGYLYYSRKHTDISPTDSPKVIAAVLVANLMISTLKEVNEVEFAVVSPGKRGVGTGGGIYSLQAESAEQKDDWVSVIRAQIETYLSRSLPVASTGRKAMLYENKMLPSSTLFVPSEDILLQLYAANPYCVDCNKLKPEWASINLAVMLCIDCAGVHRKLGAHLSKVRSLKLDKWSRNLIDLLLNIGNSRANFLWMGHEAESREGMNPKEREDMIRAKYEQRALLPASTTSASSTQYAFLLAARQGDCLGLMAGLVRGVDVNLTITTKEAQHGDNDEVRVVPVNTISGLTSSPSMRITGRTDTLAGHSEALRALGTTDEVLQEVGHLLDMTALMLACQHGHVLCVELLLLWQANLQYRNAQGLTARDVVSLTEPMRGEIIDILTNSYEAKQH